MAATEWLLDGLLAGAHEGPAAPAVEDAAVSWDYRELLARASGCATAILGAGPRFDPGDRVALLASRSALASCGFFGASMVGACVPLPPGGPAARAVAILRSCAPRCVLYDRSQARLAEEIRAAWGGACAWLRLEEACVPDRLPPPPVQRRPERLAYVLYTSGSTGTPKGVAYDHGAAALFPRWCVERYGLSVGDRVAAVAPLHFDLATFDLFAATMAGASVHVPPYEALLFPHTLAAWLDARKITVMYAVPSLWASILQRGRLGPGSLAALRLVLFAGEPFPTPQLARLMQHLPHATFENLYGPTETNVCTAYRVPPGLRETDGPIPIGAPLPHFAARIEPDGSDPAQGELVMAGPGVMAGYWGEPLAAPGPARAHATGDFVRRSEDGTLHLLGRRDRMVKVKGYRVELAEVEGALASHPEVLEAAAVAVRAGDETTLRAYYAAGGRDPGGPALRAHCAGMLPGYMVPAEFVRLEKLPRTSTGKVALSELSRDAGGRQ